MEEYTESTYGDRIAEAYDERFVRRLDTMAAVEAIADLATAAGATRVLELAIGTGRIALPLKERGFDIRGVDASEAMVAKLQEKPNGDEIPVTMGNFADVPVEGTFKLVYLVFNTLFALLTQAEQIECMQNVASHLEPGGLFVLECFVPDLARFDRGQRISAANVGVDDVQFDVAVHQAREQRVDSMHVVIRDGEVKTYPVRLRYAFPSELDLMARIAGLRLRERWGSWDREPFTDDSGSHVSIYERAWKS
ncbi:MAG TPA: class I SAM-dependent methyltransferase [Actinomycetota bacterium]|jgi:SAM-dependent methyltransferase